MFTVIITFFATGRIIFRLYFQVSKVRYCIHSSQYNLQEAAFIAYACALQRPQGTFTQISKNYGCSPKSCSFFCLLMPSYKRQRYYTLVPGSFFGRIHRKRPLDACHGPCSLLVLKDIEDTKNVKRLLTWNFTYRNLESACIKLYIIKQVCTDLFSEEIPCSQIQLFIANLP